MIRPNLLLAGIPKCGTTSLFSYLSFHPDVCASKVKETYFLMDKGHPLFNEKFNYHRYGLSGYSIFFPHCTAKKILIEATPDYFYQNTAFEVLRTLNPKPQIIFLLREPASRAYSLFQFAKNNIGIIPAKLSFECFVDNLLNNDGDMFKQRPILRNAIKHGMYSEFLDRWIETFSPDNILILLFEDLVANPRYFMKSLCRYLDIKSSIYNDYTFEKKNPTHSIRYTRLQRIRNELTPLKVGRLLGNFVKILYEQINIVGPIQKTPDDIKIIQDLKYYYVHHNERLQEITNLDISIWLTDLSKSTLDHKSN